MSQNGETGRIKTRRPQLEPPSSTKQEPGTATATIGRALVLAVTILVAGISVAASEGQGGGATALAGQSQLAGPGILIAGDGAAETYAYCIACHSERLVAQQGLTREGWEEVIVLMMEEHGMAPIESPSLEQVLGYLSTHYGPDRPNYPLK